MPKNQKLRRRDTRPIVDLWPRTTACFCTTAETSRDENYKRVHLCLRDILVRSSAAVFYEILATTAPNAAKLHTRAHDLFIGRLQDEEIRRQELENTEVEIKQEEIRQLLMEYMVSITLE